MSLRIRRGTEAERIAAGALDVGELGYATDTYRLYIGDGTTNGGRNVLATVAGTGLSWNASTQRLDFTGSGSGIISVSADPAPALGGNLTLSSHNIVGTGNINIAGTLNVTNGLSGNLNLGGNAITGTGSFNITGSGTVGGLTINANTITSSNTSLAIGSASAPIPTVRVRGQKLEFTGATASGGLFEQAVVIQTSRGSVNTPTTVLTNDILGGLVTTGYNGTAYIPKSFINTKIDTVTGTNALPGQIGFVVHDFNGNYSQVLGLNSRSVVTLQTMRILPFATTTARNNQVGTPLAGMLTFVTDNGSGQPKFQAYDGTSWIDLN